MTQLVVIDPGWSTGIITGTYSDTEPFEVTGRYQVTGGLLGFVERIETERAITFRFDADRGDLTVIPTVVVEKFTPRPHPSGGGLSLKSVEPLRIEGYLVGDEVIPDYFDDQRQWRQPSEQYWTGGTDLRDKKKRAQTWLKEHNLWTTGSQVGQPDADDVNSAMMHALGYMRDIMHIPTLTKYFKD